MNNNKYILWFNEIDKNDINVAGGKGANLGEMTKAGIPVPYGFVVTVKAYYDFLHETGIEKKIRDFLKLLDHNNPKNLQSTSENISRLILKTSMPDKIARSVMLAYLDLVSKANKMKIKDRISSLFKNPYVAVRSSATAED